jgi:CRISPR-associated protein Csx10
MNRTWLKIKLKEPLLLGGVKADTNFLSTLPYIPGRILRGAWADWLIMEGCEQEILPTVEPLRIGNFFPAVEGQPLVYASPFLLSAFTCKREGGFQKTPGPPKQRKHGIVDTLLPHLAYHLLRDKGANFPLPFAIICQKCGERMEGARGFYAVYQSGREVHYAKIEAQYHAQTKVALSRQRRAGVEKMLYTTTALSPVTNKLDGSSGTTNLVFIGQIHGSMDKVDELVETLKRTPIGSLRTRGYGQIDVEKITPTGFSPLADRLERFNELLVELWSDLKRLAVNETGLPERPEGIYFSIDLLAPGIFRQKGSPSLTPALQIDGQTLQPVFWLTRPGFAGGWSAAWGLPKPTALAVQMGSVYVFRWDGAKEVLLPALERLEAEGVGERRDESFGECLICHPFHEEVDER